ncbi:hypothetical protein J2T58_002017 [Methanocalculus alkaliphilus]|uniref:DUF7289 family protein n=1 Tax=Methanocalculus alkaliphilus TaxID=768730 RepID=UPI00209DD512|nr:hypothetical protein [Methanocalculus alkaliphilus]MCP1716142.1 hypothetical protein [Methanocalculus alkaliphilus]
MRHDDGVSEAVGFILIFSIVVTGIAIVVLYGLPLIVAGQSQADVRNMEQTMIVLQNDFKSLSYKMVPYKETALQVQGGVLTVTDASGFFEVYKGGNLTKESTPGQLRYVADHDRTHIVIENGAVLTRPGFGTGSAMIAEPRWFYDDPSNTLILSFIEIKTERTRSIAGVGRIEMKGVSVRTDEYQINAGEHVSLRYNADPGDDYSVAWGNYMTDRLGFVRTGDEYRRHGVNRLVIRTVVIRVSGF